MIDDKGITMKEKRQVLENDRKVREAATYHSIAASSVDDERGGRFATENKPTVTGSSPVRYPAQPSTSYWSRDPVGKEPPLGYCIDDQDAVGEPHEIEKSKRNE